MKARSLSTIVITAVWFNIWYVQLAFSLLMATMISALFVVGHDAAHDSLTPHKWLNRFIGTICFLPSMHPYSLWVELHNYRHHRWTNLRGKDDVWIPLDLQSYQELSSFQKFLYRIYRGPFGSLFYYLIEFWWKKFSWPTKKHYDPIKREYIIDLSAKFPGQQILITTFKEFVGVKIIGATAHYVTADLDQGPIIEQDIAHVGHHASVKELTRLGRDVERQVLARAVRWHLERRIIIHNNRTVVFA